MNYHVRPVFLVLAIAVVITAFLTVFDALVTGDTVKAGDVATDFVEMLILAIAMVFSVHLVDRLRRLEVRTSEMHAELAEAAEAGRAWRAQSAHLFESLSSAVATQFDAWGLTDAEAEVAALILKGAAQKEIAALRRTTDATIRQQAQSIYRKSGLGNRSELAADFLEDLFDVAAGRASIRDAPGPKH